MRREGVRNLKLERERGIKDREGHRAENACRHQRFPLKSSQVGSESAQATCAAGAGHTVREPENQEWERHGAQTGRSWWVQPRGLRACCSPPAARDSRKLWLRRGGRGPSWGQREALGILQGDLSRLDLRTHLPGTRTLCSHLEQPGRPGFVQRKLTPSLRHGCFLP